MKTIKIRIGTDDDPAGPKGLKLEVRDKSKEGASSSGTRIKLRVSRAMEVSFNKETPKGKEVKETQIEVLDQQEEEVLETSAILSEMSPHVEAPIPVSTISPMSPIGSDVDSFSIVFVSSILPPKAQHHSSAMHTPIRNLHDNLENVFDANPTLPAISETTLSEIDTSTVNFHCFMVVSSRNLSFEQTIVAIQTEAPSRVSAITQAKSTVVV